MLKLFLFLFAFLTINVFSQTTYYVSSSQGNDANSGTSQSTPFKTLEKVNNLSLKPGDKVLFESGNIWTGQNLVIKNSGNEQNRIIFGAYGSGNKPIISLREEIPGWKNSSNWSQYSTNVWQLDLPSSQIIQRLWIDDNETLFSNGTDGDNMDGTGAGVNSTHKFYHDPDKGKLYLYSTSNPANNYSSVKYPGKIVEGSVKYLTIALKDADYITLENLDIRGGMYASVGLGGSDHVKITNCNIGKYSNWSGIAGNTNYVKSSIDSTSDYVEIANCNVESTWNYSYVFYTQRTPYGVVAGNGASYWDIHDNFIKDWWMNIYIIGHDANSQYHNIYNNEITAPDFSFAKPMQISSGGTWGTSDYTYTNFYNNNIHDLPIGIQVSSSGNKFFNNIFRNITVSTNEHASQGNSGQGIAMISDVQNVNSKDNYIFNNTFYNLNSQAITYEGNNSFITNNIFANCNLTGSHTQVQLGQNTPGTWKNNIFFYTGYGSSDRLISLRNVGTYTVSGFNALNGKYNKTISGNLQFVGNISSLFNQDDFSIPPNSIARNAGVDISSYLPQTLKEIGGILLNTKNPNIGAVNNQEEPTGLKIFLEGPYSNGSMSTELKQQGLIPKSQPYNVSPWNYNGSETVSNIPWNTVDWVLVELRSALSSSSAVAQKAAFLRSDGSVTALDGTSKLSFGNLTGLPAGQAGAYYIVIKHRNHLSVMSALPVLLVNGNLEYDFTTSPNKAYSSNLPAGQAGAMKDLGNGVYGMFGGDTNGDGVIDDNDVTDVSSNLFKSGYKKEDVDLNSQINVLDYKLPKNNSSKSSLAIQ